ncbi:MAG: hypothetical protein AAF927_03755 [Bacteroidota bacterium]
MKNKHIAILPSKDYGPEVAQYRRSLRQVAPTSPLVQRIRQYPHS